MGKTGKFLKISLTKKQKKTIQKFTGAKSVPSFIVLPEGAGLENKITDITEKGEILISGCCGAIIGYGCTGQDDQVLK